MEATTTVTTASPATKTAGWASQTIGEKTFSVAVFGLSTALSAAFAYYLFADPSRLTEIWVSVRALPFLVQLVVWLLCLPWMIALWIWSTPLAFAVRLVLVVAMLVFTEYLMWPLK